MKVKSAKTDDGCFFFFFFFFFSEMQDYQLVDYLAMDQIVIDAYNANLFRQSRVKIRKDQYGKPLPI